MVIGVSQKFALFCLSCQICVCRIISSIPLSSLDVCRISSDVLHSWLLTSFFLLCQSTPRFLKWDVKLLTSGSSTSLIYAFSAINCPLSITLAASHKSQYVVFIFITFIIFLKFLLRVLWSMDYLGVCSCIFMFFGDFPSIFLLLIPSVIPFC